MDDFAPLPPVCATTEFVLMDARGHPVLVIAQHHATIIQPDGSMMEHKRNASLALVDGMLWHPGMTMDNLPIMLGVCEFCRHPPKGLFAASPKHGLCSQLNGMLCASCGFFTCPNHRKEGHDGRWRCRPCAKAEKRRRLGERVFFTEK